MRRSPSSGLRIFRHGLLRASCSTAGVHTRTAQWIEVLTGRTWTNLNPETGEIYPEKAPLLPLAVGGLPAVAVTGAEVSDIRWALSRQVVSQWKLLYERITRSAHFLDRWSLLQLPPEFQGTFRILLLVPIGTLIIAVLRNVVGLPTFGIFMPMLIALAFRSTGPLYGIAIFCGVLAVGFAVRSFLDRLHLLLVPRLSVILTLVIACFTVLALVGNKWGVRELMAVGLIPFVILTMTIERFFIIIEESGSREALITAAGSIAVSIVTYGIIGWETLQMTFFVYPELILSVAALQILLGRYTGYRLSELFRFRKFEGNAMIFDGFRRLREAGVLGMNRRNAEYIMVQNARSAYPSVDDKVLTKRLAEKFGIPIARIVHGGRESRQHRGSPAGAGRAARVCRQAGAGLRRQRDHPDQGQNGGGVRHPERQGDDDGRVRLPHLDHPFRYPLPGRDGG